jgi:hypothetical protein
MAEPICSLLDRRTAAVSPIRATSDLISLLGAPDVLRSRSTSHGFEILSPHASRPKLAIGIDLFRHLLPGHGMTPICSKRMRLATHQGTSAAPEVPFQCRQGTGLVNAAVKPASLCDTLPGASSQNSEL